MEYHCEWRRQSDSKWWHEWSIVRWNIIVSDDDRVKASDDMSDEWVISILAHTSLTVNQHIASNALQHRHEANQSLWCCYHCVLLVAITWRAYGTWCCTSARIRPWYYIRMKWASTSIYLHLYLMLSCCRWRITWGTRSAWSGPRPWVRPCATWCTYRRAVGPRTTCRCCRHVNRGHQQ